jgi:hypothetical protein
MENVEFFNCLGSLITNYANCMRGVKSRIDVATEALNNKKALFTSGL